MLSMTLGATLTPDVQAQADSLVNQLTSIPVIGSALPKASIQSYVNQALGTVMDAAAAGAEQKVKQIVIPAVIAAGAAGLVGFFFGVGAWMSSNKTRDMIKRPVARRA